MAQERLPSPKTKPDSNQHQSQSQSQGQGNGGQGQHQSQSQSQGQGNGGQDMCQDTHGNPISSLPFPYPGDCGKFYQCSNGHLTSQNCAEGTVFNPELSVCDWPANVPGCGGTSNPPPSEPS